MFPVLLMMRLIPQLHLISGNTDPNPFTMGDLAEDDGTPWGLGTSTLPVGNHCKACVMTFEVGGFAELLFLLACVYYSYP